MLITSALLHEEAPMTHPPMTHMNADPGGSSLPRLDEESCDSLAVTLRKIEAMYDCLVVEVEGQINSRNAPFFQRSMMKAIDSGFVDLILVFKSLKKIPSRVLRILAQLRKAAADKGVHIWSMSSRGSLKTSSA